ncbi:MAG: hypothetical protein ABIP31_10560 [Chitinophagaceae bacterium]
MKQVSTAIHSLDLRSPLHHTVNLRKVFVKWSVVLLLIGFVVISSSFQKENHISSSQKLLKTSVPFKGKYTYNIATNTGTGTASHIGRFTIVELNNVSTPNPGGGLIITGDAFITAANGDIIKATHSGIVTFLPNNMADVTSEFTISPEESTGRFAGANGSFEIEGPVNLTTGIGSFTFYGTISY